MEEPVNDYAGKVDVSLTRDEFKIACEISVTNTVEYEVQNIQKCFTAGYSLVYMISNDLAHLNTIRTLAVSKVDQSLHNRLFFVSKDDFVNQLDLLLAQQSQPVEVRAKGYRVQLNYSGSADASSQQKALKDVILASMRRKVKGEMGWKKFFNLLLVLFGNGCENPLSIKHSHNGSESSHLDSYRSHI